MNDQTKFVPQIIIMDDDPHMATFLKAIISKDYDANVIACQDEMEFIKESSNHHISVAIIDINLTAINGLEIAKKLRKLKKNEVPIVFISADLSQETTVNELGMDHTVFIGKPINPEKFMQSLLTFL